MLQKFAMVKYGVFVAKICKHALRASAVRDIWWSPLARQLLPPWIQVWQQLQQLGRPKGAEVLHKEYEKLAKGLEKVVWVSLCQCQLLGREAHLSTKQHRVFPKVCKICKFLSQMICVLRLCFSRRNPVLPKTAKRRVAFSSAASKLSRWTFLRYLETVWSRTVWSRTSQPPTASQGGRGKIPAIPAIRTPCAPRLVVKLSVGIIAN